MGDIGTRMLCSETGTLGISYGARHSASELSIYMER